MEDIKAPAGVQSQTAPTFETTRLFTRLTAAEIRRQLMAQKGYRDDELLVEEKIRVKTNPLDYRLRSVQKSRPQKEIPIFSQLDKLAVHFIVRDITPHSQPARTPSATHGEPNQRQSSFFPT